MALQLILGNSGAGKSHYLFEKIIAESMECPNRQFLVIVPEQFTMQTQKDLVMMHPRHGIMNIDVLSFDRLAHRVFEETGGEYRKILEDTGKNLILRRLAEEKKGELTLLGGNLRKLGYISEVKSLLSEFVQYRITPEDLTQMMERNQDNPQLYYKLKDMKVIYESFQEYLKEEYLTSEQLLDVLEQTVEQSASVRGSVIVLDGYTGFTPVQMKLLGRLMNLAEEVYITLTMDSRESVRAHEAEHQLFYLTKKTIRDLFQTAEDTKTSIRKTVVLDGETAWRFREAPALSFLEQKIFRHEHYFWGDSTDAVCLYAAGTPRSEADHIGREILKLVRDEGFRYRDIAVVTGNPEVYAPLMEETFARLSIPGFTDQKRDVLKNPFVEFLRALLSAVQEDFSYESMFRFLRSGMTQMTSEETDQLENYVLARGIRGISGWKKEWKYPLKGMQEEELDALNELRQKAICGLQTLRDCLKKKDGDAVSMTRGVYDYLVGLGIQEKLKGYELRFEKEGSFSLAKEYSQIYGMVMELFDKLVQLLGPCRMDLAEYAELLDAGFSEMKVGLIPAGTDQVVVGDMERSRLKDVKVLFFAGVNEGSVAREKSRGGLLSEMDRERLAEQEVELAPTSRQETCIQKFYMYLNLTKPSQRLILSWSLADADGKSLRPSWLIASIKELFPKVDIRTEADRTLTGLLALPEGSLTELTEAVQAAREQKETRLQQELIRWYAEHKEWQQKLDRLLDAVFYVKKEQPIGHAVARALYGTLLEGSVTRLEQFAACAYAHFLQYGLRLKERELSGLQAVDMGNVFHDALKYFSDTVSESEYDWLHVPDEKRDSWMEESLERALEKYAERGLDTDAQDAYAVERMKRIGKRTAWAVMEQLKKGMFVPERTEVSFRNLEQLSSVSVLLSEDERMRLQGRIDRIDVCRQDGNVYVRVIDYKSGMTKFDLTSVYYGLQLQLAVYLNAAMEMEQRDSTGEVHPAGMFYYHIQDPMLDYEEESDPVLRILKELALNGIVNADPQIVNLMDRESGGGSSVLPVKFKKDGGYTASSSVAEETQLQRLSRHVSRKLSEYGERILDGEISLSPYELKDDDACRFCSFHSICGFDRRLDGCEKRRLEPLERAEVWKKLEEEES